MIWLRRRSENSQRLLSNYVSSSVSGVSIAFVVVYPNAKYTWLASSWFGFTFWFWFGLRFWIWFWFWFRFWVRLWIRLWVRLWFRFWFWFWLWLGFRLWFWFWKLIYYDQIAVRKCDLTIDYLGFVLLDISRCVCFFQMWMMSLFLWVGRDW